MPEMVNHPAHYNEHPSGVECIEVIRPLCFSLGSAIKYFWRCSLKGSEEQDIEKAIWYLKDMERNTSLLDPVMTIPRDSWAKDIDKVQKYYFNDWAKTGSAGIAQEFPNEVLNGLLGVLWHMHKSSTGITFYRDIQSVVVRAIDEHELHKEE